MITFPPEFVATRYPGYFWNINDNKLYSIKVTGMLRPLQFIKPNGGNHGYAGDNVSVNGRHRYLHLEYLKTLSPKRQKVPLYDKHQLSLF